MNTIIRPQLWSRDFILLTLVNLFMASGSFLLIPVLPVFAQRVFQAGESEIGLIVGVYTLSALFLRPIAGIALDNWGRRGTYLLGLALFVSFMPSYVAASTIGLLFIIRLIHGFTWGIVTTGGSTIVSDIVPAERRGEGIGYFGMSFTISMALGPVLGLSLIQYYSYQFLFYTTTFISAIALGLAFLVNYPKINFPQQKSFRITRDQLYEAKVLPAALIALLCSAVYGGLISFITLFMQETGIKTGLALLDSGAIFFVAYAFGLTIIRPIAGRLMDRNGPAQVMGFGFIMLSASLFLMASVWEIVGFVTAALGAGIGMGALLPTIITMIVNLVPPHRRGVANATFFSAVDIGVGVGTILLGYIAQFSSVRIMYFSCALIILLSLALFFRMVLGDYLKKFAQMNEPPH